jgi:hypothetical protein
LTLAFIDMGSLLMFAVWIMLAVAFRKTMAIHARFMGSTALIALPPALGRAYAMNIPSVGGLPGALDPSFFTVEGILLVLMAFDFVRERRVHAPYLLSLAAFAAIHVSMWRAPDWAWFVELARAAGLPANM